MNDDALNKLIRHAAELRELEASLQGRPVLRMSPSDAGRRPEAASRRSMRIGWLVAAPFAAAACWLAFVTTDRESALPHAPLSTPAVIQIREVAAGGPGSTDRPQRFVTEASQQFAMMALLRTWSNECECLSWTVHEFEDGGTVAMVDQLNRREVAIDVADAPPVAQLLVVAAADRRTDLPTTPAQTEALLACLNDRPVAHETEVDAVALSDNVMACLPHDVAVVPKAFVVRRHRR